MQHALREKKQKTIYGSNQELICGCKFNSIQFDSIWLDWIGFYSIRFDSIQQLWIEVLQCTVAPVSTS